MHLQRTTYAAGLLQRRHSHDYGNVTVILAGRIEEATEFGSYCAQPGSVVSKGAGCEHEDRVGGFGASTLSIRFSDRTPLAPGTWAWLDTPDVVRRALALCRAASASDAEAAAAALIEAVTAPPPFTAAPPWVDELRSTIERDPARTIRFEDFARDIGLHPVYLSRAFRRHVGMSPCAFRRAVRLRNARHVLSSSRRSVGAIAAECGFADSSHLCRTFSELLGATPAQYRKLMPGRVH